MAHHPFLLVDEKKRTGAALRAPLVLEHHVFFGEAGFTLRPHSDLRDAALAADGGLQRLGKGKKGGLLSAGEAFKVGRHPYRLTLSEELIVDPHRLGDFVLFNCFHAVGDEMHWRAFRVDDATRELLDWTQSGASPTSFGITLPRLVQATIGRVEVAAPLARAAVDALVRAAQSDQHVDREAVVITWDGRAHAEAPRAIQPREDHLREDVRAMAVLTARQLRGEAFGLVVDPLAARKQDLIEHEDLARAPRADARELAAFLRGLFPAAWAVEEALRERVALLEIDALR